MPTGELVKYFLLLATSIFKQQPNNNNNHNNNDDNNFYGYDDNNNDDYYNEITTATTASTTTTAQHDSLQYTTDYYFDYFNDSSFFNSCIYSDVVDLDCLSYWMMMNFSNFDLSTPLDDLLDELPSNFGALFLLPFPVLTVFGNILVVLSVIKERNLQTVTNYFIVSLAVADIMVAIFVMPLAVYVEVNNSLWMLGDILCDVWVALDVLCCTASILNLTAISVDRYFAVTQPIKYARHKNSKRVYVMLGVTWVISVAISSPIVLGANYTERRTQTKYLCTFYNSNFLIYSSMGSFYIPCIVMVLLYGKIFNAIRVRARKAAAQKKIKSVSGKNTAVRIQSVKTFQSPSVLVNHCTGNVDDLVEEGHNASRPCVVIDNRNAVETSLVDNLPSCRGELCEPFSSTKTPAPLNSEDRNDVTSQVQMKGNAVVISNKSSCDCQNAVLSDAEIFTDSCTHTNSIFLKAPVSDEHHESPESCACGIAIQPAHTDEGQLGSRSPMRDLKTSSDQERNCRRKTDVRSTAHTFHFRFKKTKVKKSLKNEKKLQSAQRRERKATKTLAIVLGVFLFCWVPFFTINIMNAICIRYDLVSGVCQLDPILFSFFVWLGYMNSFINPVIYTIFNIEFRRAFKKLLKPIFKFKDA